MDLKKLFNSDKAVSPVIGVVLMVAITVILAAAIGSSVFGQGPSESAPQANIDISVANSSAIKLEHLGGDTIVFNSNTTTKITFANDTKSFEIDISPMNGKDFDVGDTTVLLLKDAASNTTTQSQPSGGFATVKIVDVKTSQLIADKDLRF
jgi:flagellin-like protein